MANTGPMSLHPLERTLLSGLREGGLLPEGSTGLVSVSGGADSTALLLLLYALRERLGIALEVLTFDHGLRPESAAEVERVVAQADRLGLICHVRRGFCPEPGRTAGDVPAGKPPPGVQAAARAWRRRETLALVQTRGADWVATGHQREDHWETLLLKLLRGAHLSRLRGMAPRNGPWVRPLLGVARAELERYLYERGESWCEDASNRSPKYRRNRVRHELLPVLEALTPGGIGARLNALERQSRALAEWIAAQPAPPQNDPAQPPHWIDRAALRAQPALLREAALHEFLAARMPGQVDAATLERAAGLIEGSAPWELHLSGRRSLKGRGAKVLLERREAERMTERTIAGYRVLAPESWAVRLTRPNAPSPESRATEGGILLRLQAEHAITVRGRKAGDRILLPGEAKPVKVAVLLRESGVPPWARERVPVVLSGDTVVAVFPDWVAAGHEARDAVAGVVRVEVAVGIA